MAALLQISDVPFTYYLIRQPYFLGKRPLSTVLTLRL